MGSGKDFGKDHKDFANMPREVRQEEYPKRSTLGYDIDDTITGIDQTIEHGKQDVRKHQSNQK